MPGRPAEASYTIRFTFTSFLSQSRSTSYSLSKDATSGQLAENQIGEATYHVSSKNLATNSGMWCWNSEVAFSSPYVFANQRLIPTKVVGIGEMCLQSFDQQAFDKQHTTDQAPLQMQWQSATTSPAVARLHRCHDVSACCGGRESSERELE